MGMKTMQITFKKLPIVVFLACLIALAHPILAKEKKDPRLNKILTNLQFTNLQFVAQIVQMNKPDNTPDTTRMAVKMHNANNERAVFIQVLTGKQKNTRLLFTQHQQEIALYRFSPESGRIRQINKLAVQSALKTHSLANILTLFQISDSLHSLNYDILTEGNEIHLYGKNSRIRAAAQDGRLLGASFGDQPPMQIESHTTVTENGIPKIIPSLFVLEYAPNEDHTNGMTVQVLCSEIQAPSAISKSFFDKALFAQ
jgi:hypothetical protein